MDDADLVIALITSSELQDDKAVVLAIISQNRFSLIGEAYALRNDREIVLATLSQDIPNDSEFKYATDELKGNKAFILDVLKQSGRVLMYLPEELTGDKEVVLTAVSQFGLVIFCASDELKGDRDVILAAVGQNAGALYAASLSPERLSDRAYIPAIFFVKFQIR